MAISQKLAHHRTATRGEIGRQFVKKQVERYYLFSTNGEYYPRRPFSVKYQGARKVHGGHFLRFEARHMTLSYLLQCRKASYRSPLSCVARCMQGFRCPSTSVSKNLARVFLDSRWQAHIFSYFLEATDRHPVPPFAHPSRSICMMSLTSLESYRSPCRANPYGPCDPQT